MVLAMVIGLSLGLRYNRKRLYRVYGILTPAASGINRDPFKQILVTTLAGSMFLMGIPQAAFADGPQYDPVFYYYHADHLGSAQVMTDRNGEAVQCYNYSAFGKEWYKDNSQAFDVSNRYTGQVLDEDTGLYYYGARYYDQELGRFIQADSVVPDEEMSQALNRYAYVVNNPLKFVDPTGQIFGLISAFFAAFGIEVAAATIMHAMIAGAIVGAAMAAATGGNILEGALVGGLGGMFGATQNIFMAMAGGALGAVATGGDPLMGALTAGVALGVSYASLQIPVPSISGDIHPAFHLIDFGANTLKGAVAGGVTAEIFGGDFGQGALYGAAGAAAGYIVQGLLEEHLVRVEPEPEDIVESMSSLDKDPKSVKWSADILGGSDDLIAASKPKMGFWQKIRNFFGKFGNKAFNTAKSRYPKQYQQYSKLTQKRLQKAVNSHTKRIAQHQNFIKNPASHVKNWNSLRPRHQQELIRHWQQDIARHQAYRDIAKGILRSK